MKIPFMAYFEASALIVKYVMAIFAIFLLLLCVYVYGSSLVNKRHEMTNEQIQEKILTIISEEDFLGIFYRSWDIGEEKHRGVYQLGPIVERYLVIHRKNKLESIKLLKDNGFAVRVAKPEELESKAKNHYDEVILGRRNGRMLAPFAFMSYEVELYFSRDNLVYVHAQARPSGI